MMKRIRSTSGFHSRSCGKYAAALLAVSIILLVALSATLSVRAEPGTDFNIRSILPASFALGEHDHNSTNMSGNSTVLYLAGSGALSQKAPSSGSDGSIKIPAGAGTSMKLLGKWQSKPVGSAVNFDGGAAFSIWASASNPLQQSAEFHMVFGVNDNQNSDMVVSDSNALSSSPQEYSGSGTQKLALKPGDAFSIWLYVVEMGGGGSVLYGSAPHPSHIMLDMQSIKTSVTASKSGSDVLGVRGTISTIWNVSDITGIELRVIGPFTGAQDDPLAHYGDMSVKSVDRSGMETEVNGNSINFRWTWNYGGDKPQSGTYYVVLNVSDSGGVHHYDYAPVSLSVSAFSLSADNPYFVAAVLLAVLAASASLYILHKKRATKNIRGAKGAALKILAVLVMATLVVSALATFASPPAAGAEPAPDFTLKDTDGKTASLSSMGGRTVLLDLMATWCPTCKQETEVLKSIHDKYPNLVIISISVDATESNDQLIAYKSQSASSWTYARDTDGIIEKYQVSEIPKLVLIDGRGYITYIGTGYVPEDVLSEKIDKTQSGALGNINLGYAGGLTFMAMLAGFSAFFSPCALPLLPGYVAYNLGEDKKAGKRKKKGITKRAIVGGIAAAGGVLLIYLLIGSVIALAGAGIKPYLSYVAPIVAIIIILLGLSILLNYEIPIYRLFGVFSPIAGLVKKNAPFGKKKAEAGSYGGFFVYGASYGGASLACHAPIFLSLMLAALVSGGFASGLFAFVAYGLGFGSLMLATTILVSRAKSAIVKRMRAAMPIINKLSAVILVAAGVYLVWYYLAPK